MDDDEADKLINPPLVGVRDEDVLCPPIGGSVADYMRWLADNQPALAKFFGKED